MQVSNFFSLYSGTYLLILSFLGLAMAVALKDGNNQQGKKMFTWMYWLTIFWVLTLPYVDYMGHKIKYNKMCMYLERNESPEQRDKLEEWIKVYPLHHRTIAKVFQGERLW